MTDLSERVRGILILLAITAGPTAAQQRPCDPPTPLGPSHDLYCIELVAAPGIAGVSGRVELAHDALPISVAVTPDGRPRYIPIVSLEGLPLASSMVKSPSAAYIAWAAPPLMDPVIKLGAVRDGSVALRAIDLEKLVVLITAERDPRAREPSGRMVLRGQSPSTRLFPPDLLEFAIGTMGQSPGAGHREHGDSDGARDSLHWPTVPMPPGLTMLPAEMALRPGVTPYLPAGTPPFARPRELMRLADGDTLRLEASLVRRSLNGQTYTMYGFNGQYPGPLIEVARGSEIIVAFTNRLPESTTVHWHGIRLDNRFDGVSDLTQPAVPPGGAFTYRVRFPDSGIYWYHPHVREDVQQELGLYGNVLVRSPDGAEYGPANREQVLMLDDLLVGAAGPIPLGRESPTHALMGRFGNVFLVNGEPDYRLAVRRGEVIRFFLTNASSTRTLNLSFAGARMKVVASDAGAFEREAWVESVVIAPAERYVVHVRFDRPGRVALVNRVQGLDHLFGRFFPEVDTLGTVEVAPERVGDDLAASFAALRRDGVTTHELEPYRRFLDRPPHQSRFTPAKTPRPPT